MSRHKLVTTVEAVLAAGLLVAHAAAASEPAVADARAANCRVKFVERRSLSVERPGILSEVANEGVRVEAGEIVLRVRDAVPKSALAVATARADSDADVRAAQKEHEAAEFEYQTHLSARPGAYSEVDIRRVKLAWETAALKVEQAKYEREVNLRLKEQAEDELKTYYVPSTISGLVTRAFKGAGEAVQLGEPILEVVNTETVRVEGFVPLADIGWVKVGMPVTVSADLSGSADASRGGEGQRGARSVVTVEGDLGFVDVDVTPVAKLVRVWADVPNREGLLRDGLDVELIIHAAERPTGAAEAGTSSR
jgi:multidrug resistance efflux pump